MNMLTVSIRSRSASVGSRDAIAPSTSEIG